MTAKSVDDILWNLPERKTGTLSVVGGHVHSFSAPEKTAEFLETLPLKTVRLILPDALKKSLPPLPNLVFVKSTTSGSFDKSPKLTAAFSDADAVLLAGDFSKNAATTVALAEALKNSETPAVLARDALDALTPEAETVADRENCVLVATLTQLQKFLRALYYPKMLLLSMPIQPVKDLLHKFTLTYPLTILTFHEGQLLVAKSGEVFSVPLAKTPYTALTLWTGDLPAKIAALMLWNPDESLACIKTAISVAELTAGR